MKVKIQIRLIGRITNYCERQKNNNDDDKNVRIALDF